MVCRKPHQRAGRGCSLAPPDRAPFTFFANRCPTKGNGTVEVLGLDHDPHAALWLWARWRHGARTAHRVGPVRLFYQEPRIVEPAIGPERFYPGKGNWQPLATVGLAGGDQVTCYGGHVYLLCSIPPRPPPLPPVGPPSDGWPVYHSGLFELPIDGLVDRICAARAERPRSVLTLDRRKKPW